MIGYDVCDDVIEFFKKGKLFRKINFILIIFIFKVEIFELVMDFKFIFCCGILYKIIIKIINDRMKDVLGFLVGFEEVVFVKGRNICDNIMMVYELVKYYIRKNIFLRVM